MASTDNSTATFGDTSSGQSSSSTIPALVGTSGAPTALGPVGSQFTPLVSMSTSSMAEVLASTFADNLGLPAPDRQGAPLGADIPMVEAPAGADAPSAGAAVKATLASRLGARRVALTTTSGRVFKARTLPRSPRSIVAKAN